jgi:hypothetical protein
MKNFTDLLSYLSESSDDQKADWEKKHPNMPYDPKDYKAGVHHWGPKGSAHPGAPKHIVTKPGNYKARNGKRVEIHDIGDEKKSTFHCKGHKILKEPGNSESHRDYSGWTKHGAHNGITAHAMETGRKGPHTEHPWDIVGHWGK